MKIIWTNKFRFLDFLILKNFSRILEKFHFWISILRHFYFTFHSRSRFWGLFISLFFLDLDLKAFSFHFSFSKWVKLIFISLFISRNEWTRFSFHFSLLERPIPTFAGHCTHPHPSTHPPVRLVWFSEEEEKFLHKNISTYIHKSVLFTISFVAGPCSICVYVVNINIIQQKTPCMSQNSCQRKTHSIVEIRLIRFSYYIRPNWAPAQIINAFIE